MALSRRKERETVFRMLFSCGFGENGAEEIYDGYIENLDDDEAQSVASSDYVRDTFLGAYGMIPESDAFIEQSAEGWAASRIPRTARALIRLGLYEMDHTDIPESIVINEAVEIAKLYDEQKVASFVNAVLGKAAKRKASDEG